MVTVSRISGSASAYWPRATKSWARLSCSDQRFKTNITPLADALDTIETHRPVSFDWKREDYPGHRFGSLRQTGLIAQQVREVLPDVVQEDGEGYLSVDYGRLTPVLVGAVKALREECKRIQYDSDRELADRDHRIADLHARNGELAARLERLEGMVAQSVRALEVTK